MTTIQENLTRYLEIETLLNIFFSKFDYCFEQCIKIELFKNNNRPIAACCKNKYYKIYDLEHPSFDLLRNEREKRYGNPEDHIYPDKVSPCEYHVPESGCVLTTHKSPICLAFMCRESIDVLRKQYSIYEYDYLGINYALEWILTGDFSEKQYQELKDSCIMMIDKISNQS